MKIEKTVPAFRLSVPVSRLEDRAEGAEVNRFHVAVREGRALDKAVVRQPFKVIAKPVTSRAASVQQSIRMVGARPFPPQELFQALKSNAPGCFGNAKCAEEREAFGG